MTLPNSQFSSAYADTYQNPFKKKISFFIDTSAIYVEKKLFQSIEQNKKQVLKTQKNK